MGNCWGAEVKTESPSPIVFASGRNCKHGSKKGTVLSASSRRVSSSSAPQTPGSEGEILSSSKPKSFTFSELRTATRNFRPDSVLGEGGFGAVFKGWIDEHTFAAAKPGTGLVIAVKKLNQESFQGHREWMLPNVSEKTFLTSMGLFAKGLLLCDVYSFGVVLVELLTGQRAIDNNRPSEEHNLVEWAKPYLANKRRVIRIMDSRLQGRYSVAGAQRTAGLALQCLCVQAKRRPSMDQLVVALEQLQEAKDVERTPKTEPKSSGHRGGARARTPRRNISVNGKVARPSPLRA
ncbi:hypothetical protein BHM03_00061113 [Ensete ventricosum]|nr:hypothetical protein BHM03_00061113 [Ensete ventricosum]